MKQPERARLAAATAEARARAAGWGTGAFDGALGAWVRLLWAGGDDKVEALVREFWQTKPWDQTGGAP